MFGRLAAEACGDGALGSQQRFAVRARRAVFDLHRLDPPDVHDLEVLGGQDRARSGKLPAAGATHGLGQDRTGTKLADGDSHGQPGFGARPSDAMREATICLSKGLTT